MRIVPVNCTMYSGGKQFAPGVPLEVDDGEAAGLIVRGFALPDEDPAPELQQPPTTFELEGNLEASSEVSLDPIANSIDARRSRRRG